MTRTLLLTVLALLVAHTVAHAEVPNRSPSELRRVAEAIVVGVVDSIDERVERQGDFDVTTLTFTVTVERVDQGSLDLLDTTISTTAWRRAWIGDGGPPPGPYGHRDLPSVGERGLFHLDRVPEVPVDTPWRILSPNGARPAATPTAIDIEFEGHGGMTLAGTLLLPPGASNERPVAAALLLPGSGPSDRNGNQLPTVRTDLLKTLAESLADHGVATLRFDKRAVVRYSAVWPQDPDAIPEFFALDRFVGDAVAGLKALGADERVDADRLVVIGHSEGGLIALSIGAMEDRPALRGLGLLATAGRTLDIVIREQIVRSLDEGGVMPEFRAALLESLDATIASVRERGEVPDQVHPMLMSLFNPSTRRIMVDYFMTRPLPLAAVAPGSVLVMNGSADRQVSAIADAAPLYEALTRRQGGTARLVILNDVGHNLKPTDRSDQFNFAGPVSPIALSTIVDWAQEALAE